MNKYNETDVCLAVFSHNADYSGRSPGRAGGPVGCGHSKLASERTVLPLTSVQFTSVTEVVTKKCNKFFFLRRLLKLKFGHAFVVGI